MLARLPTAELRRRLSMFVVDMRTPGVSVVGRPTMGRYNLWDISFDGVILGPDALLGRAGDGWHQLARAVEEERNGMFGLGWCQRLFDELVAFSIPLHVRLSHVAEARRRGPTLFPKSWCSSGREFG